MLNAPKTSDRKDAPPPDDRQESKTDRSAEFIHELAESGTASELGTVKAAADAIESEKDKAGEDRPKRNGSDA